MLPLLRHFKRWFTLWYAPNNSSFNRPSVYLTLPSDFNGFKNIFMSKKGNSLEELIEMLVRRSLSGKSPSKFYVSRVNWSLSDSRILLIFS